MARCLYMYFILFLTFGQRRAISSAPTYGLQEAIDDISYFIPGSKLVLTTALKLAYVYAEIRQIVSPNSTQIQERLDMLNEKVDAISSQLGDMHTIQLTSISEDVKDVKDILNEQAIKHVPMAVDLLNQVRFIHRKINEINALFNKFLRFRNSSQIFENSTLLKYAEAIIHETHGIGHSILIPIHDDITEKYSHANILQVLADKRLSMTMMCISKPPTSFMQIIINLYHNIVMAEVKGVVLTAFAYSVKRMFEKNTTYKNELEIATVHSYNRTISTILEVKRALYRASRDFWSCDPSEYVDGFTHATLGPIFQAYFLREHDIGDPAYLRKIVDRCSGECANRKDSRDLCRSEDCRNMGRPCAGMLHNCKSTDDQIHICLADENSISRYEYVEYKKKGDVFGQKHKCKKEHEFPLKTKPTHNFPFSIKFIIPKCEMCLCTCENSRSEIDRYFNLQDVTSDVESNKIVTGVRLTLANNIFHMQIQQGLLGENGNVEEETVQWKPINSYNVYDENIVAGRDFHNITYNERTVLLDSVDSSKDDVLTGLRFQLEENNLKLEIQVTPFKFSSGEMKKHESRWLSNTISIVNRTELDVSDLNLPTSSFINNQYSNNNQYVQFTTSSLKADVGQSVVPCIDLQEVSSVPPMPLSGAGLIHRGDSESAGFLSIKLRTYNFAPHLHV